MIIGMNLQPYVFKLLVVTINVNILTITDGTGLINNFEVFFIARWILCNIPDIILKIIHLKIRY